ncbi:MAG TPA: peptidase S9 [Phycisphaerales bacterium]|nr:peptidase S9 [Phycisphaerales bacterium]
MNQFVMLFILLAVCSLVLAEQQVQNQKPDAVYTYKHVEDVELKLNVYFPPDHKVTDKRPAIVFYFGGGWTSGNMDHFKRQSLRLAQLGMVAITPDYRTKKRHGTPPFDCVADAKSAMRWVRKNAAKLGVDAERIVAGGGSAGGHLAAACALIKSFDDPQDDVSISPVPVALVLFNPVIDNGPGGYGHDRIKDKYPEFSPLHNITQNAPPTLIMLGDKDKLIPVATMEEYKKRMQQVGSECEVIIYKDQGHGFFNRGESFKQTLEAAETFLKKQGFIKQ